MPDPDRARSVIESHMDPVAYSELAPGDAVSFVVMNSVQHFGLITEINPHRFIHAYQPAGKVVEQSLADSWLRRLRGCYKFREAAPWASD